MISALTLLGGPSGAIRFGAGVVAGMVAMRLLAGLWLIPAAEEVARSELRAEFAAAAAAHVVEAANSARRIEKEVRDESDAVVLCELDPSHPACLSAPN